MTSGREGKYVTLGYFLRKELGEALRNTENMSKELTPLSSVAYGATPFLWKGALAFRHASLETQGEGRNVRLLPQEGAAR